MNGLRKRKSAKGYMNGLEAIAHIMKVKGCSEAEAKRELLKAIKAGQIRAYVDKSQRLQ